MKIDPHSVEIGMGVVSAIAGGFTIWGGWGLRIFGICLILSLGFEVVCFFAPLPALAPILVDGACAVGCGIRWR